MSHVRDLIAALSGAGYAATFDSTGGGCYAVHVQLSGTGADGVVIGVTGTDVFYAADLDSDDDVEPDAWTALLYVDGEQVGEHLGASWSLTTTELLAVLTSRWPTPRHDSDGAEECVICGGRNDAGDEPGYVPTDRGDTVPCCSVGCTTHYFTNGGGPTD
jgi:hypothetical protein